MKTLSELPRISRGSFFCLLFFFLCASVAPAQFKFREPPNRQDPDALSFVDGMALWNWFLQNRYIGTFQLEGQLIYRPSGQPSIRYQVVLDGSWRQDEQVTDIQLKKGEDMVFSRTLTITGDSAMVSDALSEDCPLPVDWDTPLVEGFPFTWFDLLMPYLEWESVEYLGPDRYLGRPAHRFQLLNPMEGASPERVVVTLDEDFAAVLKVDLFEDGLQPVQRMRVGGFKKFGEEWMVSELAWEDRKDRSSVLLKVYSFTNTR